MRTFGFLVVILAAASCSHADMGRYRDAVRAPDQDIDEMKAYREQLLNVQRARQQAREERLQQEERLQEQYETADVNAGSMQDLKRDVKEPTQVETIQKRDDATSPAPSAETPKSAAQVQAGPDNKAPVGRNSALSNILFIAVVAGCSVAGLVGLVVAGVCWYRLQKNVKAASEAEYPAYGITGPTKERVQSPGDRKLAQSAQMYHYQHQKQQMIALEKANSEMKQDGSDEDSEEENEEGDYTVYECPGLAPTGEMEVKNPLFSEDTPVTPTMPGNK